MIKKKIGLDIGTVRIGIATSDILGMFASSYEVYRRRNLFLDAKYMAELAEKLDADTFVIGLPLKLSGEEGESVKMVKEFAEELKKHSSLPIVFMDERLSTVSAERILIESNMRREKRKNVIDQVAAEIILQNYLDKLKK
ncbi:MAG: Holliday junction resolvase RuvX [Clostridia bacterium]|nr:Holliday junction resolvase RuvX [Clostridia bacterium]